MAEEDGNGKILGFAAPKNGTAVEGIVVPDGAPAGEPADNAPGAQKPVGGKCSMCSALVPRDEIKLHEQKGGGKAKLHWRRDDDDLRGKLCGPVYTAWKYQVMFRGFDGKIDADEVVLAIPIERGNGKLIAAMQLSGLPPSATGTEPMVKVLTWNFMYAG